MNPKGSALLLYCLPRTTNKTAESSLDVKDIERADISFSKNDIETSRFHNVSNSLKNLCPQGTRVFSLLHVFYKKLVYKKLVPNG